MKYAITTILIFLFLIANELEYTMSDTTSDTTNNKTLTTNYIQPIIHDYQVPPMYTLDGEERLLTAVGPKHEGYSLHIDKVEEYLTIISNKYNESTTDMVDEILVKEPAISNWVRLSNDNEILFTAEEYYEYSSWEVDENTAYRVSSENYKTLAQAKWDAKQEPTH